MTQPDQPFLAFNGESPVRLRDPQFRPPPKAHQMQHTKTEDEAFDTVGISVCTSIKAGVHPKVVSERLGHVTVITLDLYSHVTSAIARDAADIVAAGDLRFRRPLRA